MSQCSVTLADKSSGEKRGCKRPATTTYGSKRVPVCKYHQTHLTVIGRKRMQPALAVRWKAVREARTVGLPASSPTALAALRGFHRAVQNLKQAAQQMENHGMPHGVAPEVFRNAEATVRAGVVKVATSDTKLLDDFASRLLGPSS